MASRAGGSAYEGAFEAVGALLISMLAGYWFDQRYETEPAGLLVGAAFGFGAFVLRLVRLGRKLQADLGTGDGPKSSEPSGKAHDASTAPESGDAGHARDEDERAN
jgi:F0F1-type ATP synthase assembly protein I